MIDALTSAQRRDMKEMELQLDREAMEDYLSQTCEMDASGKEQLYRIPYEVLDWLNEYFSQMAWAQYEEDMREQGPEVDEHDVRKNPPSHQGRKQPRTERHRKESTRGSTKARRLRLKRGEFDL
jgi:hypothetical protein